MTLRERLAASVADIRTRGRRLVQLNRELLAAELKEKGKKFGAAIAMFIGAGLLSLYAIGFALATIAVALALVLPLWLALLIVTLALFLIVAILVLVGRDQLLKIGAPGPEVAMAEAKATADLMKANARQTATRVRERATPSRPKRGQEIQPLPPATPPPPPPASPSTPGPDTSASGPSFDAGARES
jgi:hypothetical protein